MLVKQERNRVTLEFDMVYFYYIRDNQNKPVFTVCILKHRNEYFRGVAICSVKEASSKIVGRTIALYRAMNAFFNCTDSDRINIDNIDVNKIYHSVFANQPIDSVDDFINNVEYKSMANITFTDLELRLLSNRREFNE